MPVNAANDTATALPTLPWNTALAGAVHVGTVADGVRVASNTVVTPSATVNAGVGDVPPVAETTIAPTTRHTPAAAAKVTVTAVSAAAVAVTQVNG